MDCSQTLRFYGTFCFTSIARPTYLLHSATKPPGVCAKRLEILYEDLDAELLKGISLSPFTKDVWKSLYLYKPQRRCTQYSTLHRCIDKNTVQESFTIVPKMSEPCAFSAAYQYFQLLPSLADVSIYFQRQVCPQLGEKCHNTAVSISHADYLDIDFDTIAQKFTITIYQYKPPNAESWYDHISNSGRKHIVEVGVLAIEPTQEIEEQTLGGFLTIVGENERPSVYLISLFLLSIQVLIIRSDSILFPCSSSFPEPVRGIQLPCQHDTPNRLPSHTSSIFSI